ncbi:hypothetical protein KII91_00755 [Leuconostoc gelidum subsp. gelidum]|uniref:SspB-related isopeptide-forming adhesin n=1 Tax=Leuconostoc gelidum TaxID=1244 RepID=UPI001D8318D6|nr:SspB-related isopeptide-forming adhesin [Leuconostoc gelidum]MBZ5977871.1 hypothetical protein [Leuconostoc gelidum subsp. gelidum]MBZ6001241.1 hypothetical protein [Leuconostoc gelidum subsp. gelidum]
MTKKKAQQNKTAHIKNKIKNNWQTGLMVAGSLIPMATGISPVFADDSAPKPVKVSSTGTKVKVDDAELQKAISRAKAAGVTVSGSKVTDKEVNQDNLIKTKETVSADYAKQADEILKVAKAQESVNNKYNQEKGQYQKNKAIYDTAKAKYDKDKSIFDKAKIQYDTDKKAYDTAKTQYDKDKAAYDIAKAQYDKDKATYDSAKSQFDKDKVAYDKAKAQYDKDLVQYNDAIKIYNSKTLTQNNSDGKEQSNTSDSDQAMVMDKSKTVDNTPVESGNRKPEVAITAKPTYSSEVDGFDQKIVEYNGVRFYGMSDSTGVAIYYGNDIIGKTFTKTYKNSAKVGNRSVDITVATTPTKFTGGSNDKPGLAISNNLIDNFNIVNASYKFQMSFKWHDTGKDLVTDELNGKGTQSKVFFLGGSLTPHNSGHSNEYIQTNDAKSVFIGDKSFVKNIKGSPQNDITSFYAVSFDKTSAAQNAQWAESQSSGKGPDNNPADFAQMVGVTFGDFTTNKPTFYGGGVDTQGGQSADVGNNHFMNYDAVAFNPRPDKPTEPKAPIEPKAPTEPKTPIAPKAPINPQAPTEPKAPIAPVKPKDLTANYQLTDLYMQPTAHKDIDLGTNAGDKAGSDNDKVMNKGEKLTYSLKATDLPANRTDAIKTVKYVDALPKEVDYNSAKVFSSDGKTELTKSFDVNYDKKTHTVTVTAKSDFLAEINKDKSKNYVMPIVDIYATTNKSHAKIDNTFSYFLDDVKTQSNTTHNTTPDVKPVKDVDLGTNVGDKAGSDNDKKIVKGQDLTYSLKSSDLPANRAFDVNTFKYTDVLPKEVDYKSAKVFSSDGKTELTKSFDISYDKKTHTVTFAAKAIYLKEMNTDKLKSFAKPIANIYVTANQDNSKLDNKYTESVNDDSNGSNTVHNTTPDVKPVKQDLSESDQDINGQDIKPGTTMKYKLTWDLSGLKDVAFSDDLLSKGLSFSDDYDETKLNVTAKTKTDFTVIDLDTKNSVTSDTTVTWDEKGGKWTVKANDPKAFLKEHSGHQLAIIFRPVVKNDATGALINTAVQNNFGQEYKTQTVKNNITPNPKPIQPKTPNTSYGEKPKGLIYGLIAAIILSAGTVIFWKPIKRWVNRK